MHRAPDGRDLRLSPQLLDDHEREQDSVRHFRSLRPDADAQPGSRGGTYGDAARMVRLSHAILRPSAGELHRMCLEVSIRPGYCVGVMHPHREGTFVLLVPLPHVLLSVRSHEGLCPASARKNRISVGRLYSYSQCVRVTYLPC